MAYRNRFLAATLAALVTVFVGGCAKKVLVQAFIVTASRENVKLGLMTVHVFKREVFEQFVAGRRSGYRTTFDLLTKKRAEAQAQAEELGKKFDKDTATYNGLLETAKSVEADMEDSAQKIKEERAKNEPNEEYIRAMRKSLTDFGDLGQQTLDEAKKVGEKAKKEGDDRQAAQAIVTDCDAKLQALDDDFFAEEGLSSLPALGRGKTDADGVAKLSYQGSDVVMFAQASRSVGPQTERYTWLLHNPDPALMLSNDNLLSQADRKGLIAGK